jgi:hypothetical protein
MALIAYPAENANSYVSNAAADIYFSNRLNSAKWTDADEATQDQALVTSTLRGRSLEEHVLLTRRTLSSLALD